MNIKPNFIYGTAWKEDQTEALVFEALSAGFRAIDTANQRKHYFEEAVGKGIQKFLALSSLRRENLFIQTKFTYAQGQDHRKPYDESAPFNEQVSQSFKSSLTHLGVDYLDSYILHGPYQGMGITKYDLEVWEAMTQLNQRAKVKKIGVSNVQFSQLKTLYEGAAVKPSFVQNRCYARNGWDKQVREYCLANQILYQGFSLLTANSRELTTEPVQLIAKKYRKTIPQIAFRFSQQIGMIPITGTSSGMHMAQDLDITDFELTQDELQTIELID